MIKLLTNHYFRCTCKAALNLNSSAARNRVIWKAKRKAIKRKNPQDWGNYRKLRNRIHNKVKTAKASLYHNIFIQSKGNTQRTWKIINNRVSRRQNNQIVKDVKVCVISICNFNEISNAF